MDSATGTAERTDHSRRHPCLLSLAVWTACAGCAALVAVLDHSPAWLLLAIPSILYALALARKVAQGYPNTSLEQATRFDQLLVEVGGEDAFGVIVQDQCPHPCLLLRGKRPRVIAALEFVANATDRQLRGLAALQHATLRDRGLAKMARRGIWIRRGVTFALCYAATQAAHGGATGVLASLSAAGLATWLATLITGIWSR